MMRKLVKRVIAGIVSVSLAFFVPMRIDARTYSVGKAQEYIEKYALDNNYKRYYTFRSDCTNFVSQVAYAGGIAMRYHPEYRYNSMIADVDYDYDTNYWYNDRHNSTLTVLTTTWVRVGDFRDYMGAKRRADVFTYRQTDADWEALRKRVWIGDVVQCGNHHSIVIEYVNKRTDKGIKYAGHSNNVNNKAFFEFRKWCKDYYSNEPIYLICFK